MKAMYVSIATHSADLVTQVDVIVVQLPTLTEDGSAENSARLVGDGKTAVVLVKNELLDGREGGTLEPVVALMC